MALGSPNVQRRASITLRAAFLLHVSKWEMQGRPLELCSAMDWPPLCHRQTSLLCPWGWSFMVPMWGCATSSHCHQYPVKSCKEVEKNLLWIYNCLKHLCHLVWVWNSASALSMLREVGWTYSLWIKRNCSRSVLILGCLLRHFFHLSPDTR